MLTQLSNSSCFHSPLLPSLDAPAFSLSLVSLSYYDVVKEICDLFLPFVPALVLLLFPPCFQNRLFQDFFLPILIGLGLICSKGINSFEAYLDVAWEVGKYFCVCCSKPTFKTANK